MTAAPITPAAIAAATAGPAVDLGALERALDAFVLFPAGDGLSGFDGPDAMVIELTDGVCKHLVGDFNSVPDDVHDALRAYALAHGAPLLSSSYRDAAAMLTATWHGMAERFAANAEPAR